MTGRFPKTIRLRKRRQFQRLLSPTKRFSGRWLFIDVRENNLPYSRLGITVTRRYGKAHDRNRFKRLVRESFRLAQNKIKAGLDLNVKPRPLALNATFKEITSDLLNALQNDHESNGQLRG